MKGMTCFASCATLCVCSVLRNKSGLLPDNQRGWILEDVEKNHGLTIDLDFHHDLMRISGRYGGLLQTRSAGMSLIA